MWNLFLFLATIQSCIRGKAMTMPKMDNNSSTIQNGNFFPCLLLPASFTNSLRSCVPVCSALADRWPDLSSGGCCEMADARDFCWLYFSTYSGKSFLKLGQFLLSQLYASEALASSRFSLSEDLMLPVVWCLSSMKDRSPVNILDTDHIGFQDSGWKSLMDKQIFSLGTNRPLGVTMRILGGLNG